MQLPRNECEEDKVGQHSEKYELVVEDELGRRKVAGGLLPVFFSGSQKRWNMSHVWIRTPEAVNCDCVDDDHQRYSLCKKHVLEKYHHILLERFL